MARIFPPEINKDNPSRAEKKVFQLFKDMSHDCLVFHSLGLSQHADKIFGEIDFVVVSYNGILCLEVKGGRVERKSGVWYFIDKKGRRHVSKEGPFKQILGSMHSLRSYFKKQVGKRHPLYRCQYAYGVMFPDIKFEQQDPEIISEIVFDLNYQLDQASLKNYIGRCFNYWRSEIKEKHNLETGYLNDNQLQSAKKLLRGNFGVVPSLKAEIDSVDQELIKLTQQQYETLKMLDSNKRFIVSGRAGTGKTLLGVEQARKFAIQGKKVLLLFFNKLIARNMFSNLSNEEQQNIDIDNFHNLLENAVKKFQEKKQKTYNHEYFSNQLPEDFLNYSFQTGLRNYYDVVIIDEGQDLIRDNYLMCIEEMLKDGLSRGNWIVFYDPAQNIYNQEFEESLGCLKKFQPVMMELNINCRNTREIGRYNAALTDFTEDEKYLVEGGEVRTYRYKSSSDLRKKVYNTVKNLLSQNINPGEIVILSPKKYRNSFLMGENIFSGLCPFVNLADDLSKYDSQTHLKFSTAHSFKGLESKILILAEIEKIKGDYARLLNYTAISRARVKLYFFYSEDIAEIIEKLK